MHPTACGAREVAVALARGSFEFQGQKCSAASRAYVPKSMWPAVSKELTEIVGEMTMGDVADFTNFLGAVIDARSFNKLKEVIDRANAEANVDVIIGGTCDDSEGYFVSPTVAVVQDPKHDLMRTEFFGPLLTIYVYDDDRVEETLELCATTSPYALTGAIFADDRYAVRQAVDALRYAAGNFYINDKPTGAVVGQQPFGGSRASGTNDKAGSILNLLRWVSPPHDQGDLRAAHGLDLPVPRELTPGHSAAFAARSTRANPMSAPAPFEERARAPLGPLASSAGGRAWIRGAPTPREESRPTTSAGLPAGRARWQDSLAGLAGWACWLRLACSEPLASEQAGLVSLQSWPAGAAPLTGLVGMTLSSPFDSAPCSPRSPFTDFTVHWVHRHWVHRHWVHRHGVHRLPDPPSIGSPSRGWRPHPGRRAMTSTIIGENSSASGFRASAAHSSSKLSTSSSLMSPASA